MDRMTRGLRELAEHRGGCCQLGRGDSNRAELGAVCLALEDAKRQQERKPTILLSDSAYFLFSSQKWIGEGKSPFMHGNSDADIMRDIVQFLRERIEQGLLTIFIKIKAHHGDPLNELADRWADEGRQSKNIRWSLPTNRPIFFWTDNGITHHSPMNPTVKKRIVLPGITVTTQDPLRIDSKVLDQRRQLKRPPRQIQKGKKCMDTSNMKGATMPILSDSPVRYNSKNGEY